MKTKFQNFLHYLEAEFDRVKQKRSLLTESKITYELLWFSPMKLFLPSPKVVGVVLERCYLARIFDSNPRCYGLGIHGRRVTELLTSRLSISITMGKLSTERQQPCTSLIPFAFTHSRQISVFDGSVEIGTLKVQLLDGNTKNTFKDRGNEFLELTGRDCHREYEGFMIQRIDQDPSNRPSFPTFSQMGISSIFSLRKQMSQLVHFDVRPLHHMPINTLRPRVR